MTDNYVKISNILPLIDRKRSTLSCLLRIFLLCIKNQLVTTSKASSITATGGASGAYSRLDA